MQNKSHAVMAQRHEPHDSLDDFPTPCWATRALCNEIEGRIGRLNQLKAWEPACGRGHMARVLSEYFASVTASDIYDYGYAPGGEDFLFASTWPPADWICTNPPFRLAERFAVHALGQARRGVALLVRTAFLETIGRYQRLYSVTQPALILQFTERVPMVKGRLDPEVSTATAYCWVIWTKPNLLTTSFDWIPPCRKLLEREEDYR